MRSRVIIGTMRIAAIHASTPTSAATGFEAQANAHCTKLRQLSFSVSGLNSVLLTHLLLAVLCQCVSDDGEMLCHIVLQYATRFGASDTNRVQIQKLMQGLVDRSLWHANS